MVDLRFCKKCGICVHICPKKVFCINKTIIVEQKKCSGCGNCEIMCPDLAIEIKEK